MRRIIISLAIGGLASASIVACDVEDTFEPGSDTTITQDTAGDTTVAPTQYLSVIVDDSEIFPTHRVVGTNPCATAADGAHGADIDAVALFKGNGDLAGYYDTVRLALGTQCEIDAKYKNASEVKGAPQGKTNEGFVSLGGGYVIGEFDNRVTIQPGYSIIVYEIGKEVGGNSEGYKVFVAEDNSCGQSGASRAGCQVEIGQGKGQGTFDDLLGF